MKGGWEVTGVVLLRWSTVHKEVPDTVSLTTNTSRCYIRKWDKCFWLFYTTTWSSAQLHRMPVCQFYGQLGETSLSVCQSVLITTDGSGMSWADDQSQVSTCLTGNSVVRYMMWSERSSDPDPATWHWGITPSQPHQQHAKSMQGISTGGNLQPSACCPYKN